MSPFQFIRKLQAKRATRIKQAADSISVHGDEAWSLARAHAIRTRAAEDWAVVREIERQLGIKPRLDTATRYLETR